MWDAMHGRRFQKRPSAFLSASIYSAVGCCIDISQSVTYVIKLSKSNDAVEQQ